MNGRQYSKRWKKWLGKLVEEIEREDNILGDCNVHSYFWQATREECARRKVMQEQMTGTGWMVMEEDRGLIQERTREGRKKQSRIEFVITKDNSG